MPEHDTGTERTQCDAHGRVHSLGLPCPSCHGRMQVRSMGCEHCALEVNGRFEGNEFASLSPEHLQLLRVFVLCEGRIREMEKVLGVSYPTVKNRVAALRVALGLDDAAVAAPVTEVDPQDAALAVLDALERGDLAPDEAAMALARVREG